MEMGQNPESCPMCDTNDFRKVPQLITTKVAKEAVEAKVGEKTRKHIELARQELKEFKGERFGGEVK